MATRRVLNSCRQPQKGNDDGSQLSAEQLGLQLQRCMLSVKGEFLADDGRGVDYQQLKISEHFQKYCEIAEKLNYIELNGLTEEEKKSFFINVYNSLTIHGLSALDSLPSSVLEIEGFWRNTCYNIGGLVYSLDDIEHGILRCNRPHPGGDVMFKEDDPRLQFTMATVDPRIHFALVCGAKSCPAIQVYSSAKLERSLSVAAKSFCEQEVSIDQKERKITLSKIFMWYYKDFGDTDGQLLTWISQFLPDDQKVVLEELVASNDFSLGYKDYNWLLNRL